MFPASDDGSETSTLLGLSGRAKTHHFTFLLSEDVQRPVSETLCFMIIQNSG
jgi:hypothetical protein